MTKITEQYIKNAYHEEFLEKFNASLDNLEKEYTSAQHPSEQPLIFICGCPRSGTTLLSQVLAKTGLFNYIDNFVARFWRAPFVGFSLEKIFGLRTLYENSGYTFDSDFGRTTGILDPHEFTYFWEYWLKPPVPHHVIPANHLKNIYTQGLKDEINAILNIYDKPLFFKNIWFLANPLLAFRLFPNASFVVIKRDSLLNALSIYNARKKYCGDENEWFSVRPPDYIEQKEKPVEEQIIGQIKWINSEILKQTSSFPERVIDITYEELCADPVETVLNIAGHLPHQNIEPDKIRLILPEKFSQTSRQYPAALIKRFEKAL